MQTILFVDDVTWRVESMQITLRKDIADRLGADRSIFYAAVLEVPIGLVQSVGDAVVLSVAVDDLRHVLPSRRDEARV